VNDQIVLLEQRNSKQWAVASPHWLHLIDNVRKLQRRLYIAAKCNQERRFHALYDLIWRSDVLSEAWKRVILEARFRSCKLMVTLFLTANRAL
jgi:hypothetical protein